MARRTIPVIGAAAPIVDNLVDIPGTPSTDAPSARARDLVRGAVDLHVHVDPDVIGRIVDDVTLAEHFQELGLGGFVLKSHYVPTAERAAVVNRVAGAANRVAGAANRARAFGSITLNASVGGLNPLAVEIAARETARIVWLPTVDAVNEASARDRSYPPGARVPMWVALQRQLREAGMEPSPVAVLDADGAPLPALLTILELAARHGLVLATGHIGRDEIFAVVPAALRIGVRDVVVTHPDFPAQNLSIESQLALARQGAWLERCFTTPHGAKCTWEQVFEGIRATGPERNVLSSDLGQPANPPVQDGLALFADRLLGAGFSEQEIHTMAVRNTRALAGLEAL